MKHYLKKGGVRWLKVTSFIMALCLLTNTPCDMAYEHTIDFKNSDNQFDFFRSRPLAKIVNLNVPADGYRQEFEVDMHIDDTVEFDYCCLYEGINKYYYFIVGRVQKGTMTNLFVELDVFQTYYYDMLFNESFVDRCHVNRWTPQGLPTYNIEDEGLNYGTMVIEGIEPILTPSLDFVICATSPIGKLTTSGGGGGEGGDCSGDKANGLMSANGLVYIKTEEGFHRIPDYYNGESFRTGGYGVTENWQPDLFAELGTSPYEEKQASIVLGKVMQGYGKQVTEEIKKINFIDKITIQQYDVWCSMAMNFGFYGMQQTNAWKYFISNPDDVNGIADRIAAHPSNPNRRGREAEIYRTGVYPTRTIDIWNGAGQHGGIVESNDKKGFIPPPFDKDCSGKLGIVGTDPKTGHSIVNNAYGENWLVPCEGAITSLYGWRTHPVTGEQKLHKGIDIAPPAGTPFLASDDGTVLINQWDDGFGNWLRIEHKNGVSIDYPHLQEKPNLSVGQSVKRGDVVGKCGSTGTSTGPHLHWQFNKNGETTNPIPNAKVGELV